MMFIFEFPQNLIGFIAFLVFSKLRKCSYDTYQDAYIVHVAGSWGAIALSKYIFVANNFHTTDIVKHEYGHRIQSQLLGVLFVPIIGFPSLIWASCFKRYRKKHHKSYFWFYTEAWANKLAGIILP